MHAEEVCVEHRREAYLLHDDLGQDRENLGRVVEVIVEEHEPSVSKLVILRQVYRWYGLLQGWIPSRLTHQLYDGILDPVPTIKCRTVRHGSYAPRRSSLSSSSLDSSCSPFAGGGASEGKKSCALKSPQR